MKFFLSAIVATAVLLTFSGININAQKITNEQKLIAKAKKIHDAVITIDTHADIDTKNFTESRNYTQELSSQVTLPKMKNGGLDAAFFIVYTGQGDLNEEGYTKAYLNALEKFEAIERLTKQFAPNEIELALTSKDVRRIARSGKKVAMIGIENAYPIGTNLSRIEEFAKRGARYMSLAHNGHSQLADSNTGERDGKWLHNGLSEMGKKAVLEMNKWGIMVDLSHPSKQANIQTLKLTNAPVIASHSSARTLADHSRNLDDELLELIKQNGGVVQTVAFRGYVNIEKNALRSRLSAEILKEIAAKENFQMLERDEILKLPENARAVYQEKLAELRANAKPVIKERLKDTAPDVNIKDFVDHVDYLVKKIGINHVGISSDFDGGGGVEGWDDASETFNVTLELVRRGYTKKQIEKIWSGNLLRVLDEVQRVAKQTRK